MKTFLRISVKWIFAPLLSIFLLISGLVFFFKDRICGLVLTEVNTHLNVPLKVSDMDLVFWSSFPNLSVDFEHLFIQESLPNAQVSDTLFSENGNAFRKAVLVQWPREGVWTVAFVTGAPNGEIAAYLRDEFVSVYVPTTPNPTSGFFLMMPRADVIELQMSVDEALKYVISMGVVAPPVRKPVERPALLNE